MKTSFRFIFSVLIGLGLATISTAVIFYSNFLPIAFAFNPQLEILLGSVLIPSLTVVFTILAYLILPKND